MESDVRHRITNRRNRRKVVAPAFCTKDKIQHMDERDEARKLQQKVAQTARKDCLHFCILEIS